MIKDFWAGASCVFQGIDDFYSDRGAWKYTILPFLTMAVVYALMFWGVYYTVSKVTAAVYAWIAQGPSWISWAAPGAGWVISLLGIISVIFFIAITVSVFYEIAGGIFFDPLTEYYENRKFGIAPVKLTFKEEVIFFRDSLGFGIKTLIFFVLLFMLSIFVPVIGPLLMIIGTGYSTGVSYMLCSARNSRMAISGLTAASARNRAAVTGFGVTAYLLLMIPFAALFVIPGLALGGSELFHKFLRNGQ